MLFRAVDVRVFGESGCCAWEGGRPFRPFVLGAGESAAFIVKGRFGDCEYYVGGSGNGFSVQPLRYKFMGVSHVFEAEIMPFDVQLPVDFKCPVVRPY
jgi:hypothetical protein